MTNNGITFDTVCVKDNDGLLRHRMTRSELDKLYCMLCDLLEDSTREEADRYRDSIAKIKELIHYRRNNP